MAKIAFSKLGLKVNNSEIPIYIGDQVIAVKQYLPIADKLFLIQTVIQEAHDIDNNFSNPVKTDVYQTMEIIFNYTDISFTDKQKEDIPGLYDKLVSSGTWEKIKQAIPDSEIKAIHRGVTQTIDAFYRYRNSVMGVLDNVKTDYSDLNLNLDELTEKITDPEALKFVKDFLTKVN